MNQFYKIFEGKNTDYLIPNISSELCLIGDLPILANKNTKKNNSYVSSLYSAFVSYPLEELDLIADKKARFSAKVALSLLGVVFKMIQIEKTVFFGNFLISTNFYPQNFATEICKQTKTICEDFKDNYLCIRSLNVQKNKEQIDVLQKNGWTLIPARVVYLFDFASLNERKKKNHYKNDMKLLAKTELECCSEGFTVEDFVVMQNLFEALYIKKHSAQNPHFSAEFIQKSFESKFLELYAFRQNGKIVGFISILDTQGVISTPMLGYDTNLPQEMGLYRLLCAKLHEIAEARKEDINFSSGAGEFKKLRGAVPAIEYTAVYVRHLPFFKQLLFGSFAKITNKQMNSFFVKNGLV